MRDSKELSEIAVMIYNKGEYRKTWEELSPESTGLLDCRIVSGSTKRTGKEIHPVVRFFDLIKEATVYGILGME